jgi:hypothetical protein
MGSSVAWQYRRLPGTEPDNADVAHESLGPPAPWSSAGPGNRARAPVAYAALSITPALLIAACAAASLAIGTRGGEHET